MALLVNRFCGRWWALGVALALSANQALVGLYVQAISQGIVAFLVTWALFFLLGEDRKLWQLGLAALLCSLATLTRQNMVFLLPFVVVYGFWLHGRQAGWIALTAASIPFIVVHIIYFPQIIDIWTNWLPSFLLGLFNINISPGGGEAVWAPANTFFDRVSSFFMAVRYHFLAVIGTLAAGWLSWKKKNWRSIYKWKMVLSLQVLFWLFFLMHAWASLTKNYCVFCFPNYLAFFLPVGILVGALSLRTLTDKSGLRGGAWLLAALGIALVGIFTTSSAPFGRLLTLIPVPRLAGDAVFSDSPAIWEVLRNRFGFTQETTQRILLFLLGLFLFTAGSALMLFILRRKSAIRKEKRTAAVFLVWILIAVLASPTFLFARLPETSVCNGNMLQAYEKAGKHLQDTIPPDSRVFWAGGSVATPLLYIPETDFPAQLLNGDYAGRVGGDRDALEKRGFYNQESLADWRDHAQFLLIRYTDIDDFWKAYLNPQDFVEYQPTVPLDPCDPATSLKILKRKES